MASSTVVMQQCYQCLTQGGPGTPPLKVCSSCKKVYYCSASCQTKHWKVHKPFCKSDASKHLRRAAELLANNRLGGVALDPKAPIQDENTIIFTCIPPGLVDGPAVPGGYTQCIFPPGLKEAILGQPGFPRPMPSPTAPAHRLGAVPGAGIGMYATRPLVAGEVIFAERALLVSSSALTELTDMPAGAPRTLEARLQHVLDDAEEELQDVLPRMSPASQAAYRALENSHLRDGSGPLLGVKRTNAWGIGPDAWRGIMPEGKGLTYGGVCEVLSRINHSCSPNAGINFHMPSFSFVLLALRDIPTGAEITVSYADVIAPAATRQQSLQPYGFTCTCAACAAPAAHDARRREIAAAPIYGDAAVLSWVGDGWLPDDALSCGSLRALQLVDQEGVQTSGSYQSHLAQLAAVHVALGQREKYLSVRKKSLHLGAIMFGHKGVVGAGWPEEPEAHFLWKKRVRARKLL